MMENPKLILTFMGGDVAVSTQEVTSEFILKESISETFQLFSALKSSSRQMSLSLKRNTPAIEYIIATESDIKAELYDGSSAVFTGYLSTNYSWSVNHAGESNLSLTIEDVGTRLLGKAFIKNGSHLFKCSASAAIEAIAEKAGVTLSSSIPTIDTEIVKVVSEGETCKDILSTMLYEVGYVYYFENDGKMNLFSFLNLGKSEDATLDGTKLIVKSGSGITLNKTIRQYNSSKIRYTELGTASHYLVYRNTTDKDESHPYCNLVLQGGEAFDGAEIYTPDESVTRTDVKIEAVNALSETEIIGSRTIVAIETVEALIEKYSPITASIKGVGGPYLTVYAENPALTKRSITRMDAYATVTYEKSENIVLSGEDTTSSDNTIEEELKYVHDEATAKKHAALVSEYYRYSGGSYTFFSREDVGVGKLVRVKDDIHTGLNVLLLVYAKITNDSNSIIEYRAVGYSEFNLDKSILAEKHVVSPSKDMGAQGEAGKAQTFYYQWSKSEEVFTPQDARFWLKGTGFIHFGSSMIGSLPYKSGWITDATKVAEGKTDEYPYLWCKLSEDSEPFLFSGYTGGTATTVTIYKRAAEKPSLPTETVVYNFEDFTATGLGDWSLTTPEGTEKVWSSSATAVSADGISDKIEPSEWSSPVVLVENGKGGLVIATSADSWLFAADEDGIVKAEDYAAFEVEVYVTRGGESTDFSLSVEELTGITEVAVSSSGTKIVGSTDSVMTKDSASVKIGITVDGTTYMKIVNLSKAKTGITGAGEYREYALSDSKYNAPSDGWTAAVPSLGDTSHYLWTRNKRVESGQNPDEVEWNTPVLATVGIKVIEGKISLNAGKTKFVVSGEEVDVDGAIIKDGTLTADKINVDSLMAKDLRVGQQIRSAEYDENKNIIKGYDENGNLTYKTVDGKKVPTTGFYLNKDGQLKACNAEFSNVTIREGSTIDSDSLKTSNKTETSNINWSGAAFANSTKYWNRGELITKLNSIKSSLSTSTTDDGYTVYNLHNWKYGDVDPESSKYNYTKSGGSTTYSTTTITAACVGQYFSISDSEVRLWIREKLTVTIQMKSGGSPSTTTQYSWANLVTITNDWNTSGLYIYRNGVITLQAGESYDTWSGINKYAYLTYSSSIDSPITAMVTSGTYGSLNVTDYALTATASAIVLTGGGNTYTLSSGYRTEANWITAYDITYASEAKGVYVSDVFPMVDSGGNYVEDGSVGSQSQPFKAIYAKNFYPQNSVYMTVGSENPVNLYGGTWSNLGTITVGGVTIKTWQRTT